MKFNLNLVIQLLGVVAQGLNVLTDFLPGNKKLAAAVGVGAIQGAAGVIAHYSNPDGTPPEQPYRAGN